MATEEPTVFFPPVPTKKCSRCTTSYVLEQYRKNAKSADGYSYLCKSCLAVVEVAYEATRRKRIAANGKRETVPRKDIAGERFERLFVTRTYRQGNVTYVECICDCQPETIITRRASYLISGKTRSCGCLATESQHAKFEDLTDKRFGRLLVMRTYRENRKTYTECHCDCGQQCTVWAGHLKNDHTQSCGQCDGPRVRHARAFRLSTSLRRARKRGLPATFTPSQQTFMYQYWGYACAVCGREEGLYWILADDHWIPVTAPDCPGTVASNMLPLCHGAGCCNNTKLNREPLAWLTEKLGRRQAKAKVKAFEAFFVQAQLFAERDRRCNVG